MQGFFGKTELFYQILVLLSNYENVELAEKVILKPYQTLAIYVD